MANQRPKYNFYNVDEQTFHVEMDRRIELKNIKRLSRYVLRHVSKPESNYFAYDCLVEAVEIKHSELYKKVILEAQGIDPSDSCRFTKTFNHLGFITMNLLLPPHADKQKEVEKVVGYLLGEVTHDLFDDDLKAYLTSDVPVVVNDKLPELVRT